MSARPILGTQSVPMTRRPTNDRHHRRQATAQPSTMTTSTNAALADGDAIEHILFVLNDWADLIDGITKNSPPDERENSQARAEKARLAAHWLRSKQSAWDARVSIEGNAHAARVLVDMLKDWKLPGAIWVLPSKRRFRLVGEHYAPGKHEILLGVYLPGVSASALQEDIEEALHSKATPRAQDGEDSSTTSAKTRRVRRIF
jgi:hypothetical protein